MFFLRDKIELNDKNGFCKKNIKATEENFKRSKLNSKSSEEHFKLTSFSQKSVESEKFPWFPTFTKSITKKRLASSQLL